MLESFVWAMLLRYAAAMAGAVATSAGGYAAAHWGWSPETIAAVFGGLVTAGLAVLSALAKNTSVASVLKRYPIEDVLRAIANSTAVSGQQAATIHTVADRVPSPRAKVVPVDPAGNGSVSG